MNELHRKIIAAIEDGNDYTPSWIAVQVWGRKATIEQRRGQWQRMGTELKRIEKLGLVECVRRKDGVQTWRKKYGKEGGMTPQTDALIVELRKNPDVSGCNTMIEHAREMESDRDSWKRKAEGLMELIEDYSKSPYIEFDSTLKNARKIMEGGK